MRYLRLCRNWREGEAKSSDISRCRGAAFVETVVLLAAFTLTMVSVLTIYSLTWKQKTCNNILNTDISPEGFPYSPFNPFNKSLIWRTSGPQGPRCMTVANPTVVFY